MGKKRLTVVATQEELKLVNGDAVVTGVGPLNVLKSLSDVSRDTPLFNIGYAGSNSLKIGTKVTIGYVCLYHPNVDYESPVYHLGGDIPCHTSQDFVTNADCMIPCVYDMELAYILGMGFTDVISEKIVSDNLSVKEYEEGCITKDG